MTFASQCKNSHGVQEAKIRPNSKWKQAKCLNCCNYVHDGDFQHSILPRTSFWWWITWPSLSMQSGV